MGSFEEEGELPPRAPARGAVRSLHVHVPTPRAWRLQVGQGADPGVRHLRRVQAPAAILTRATSPWPLSRRRGTAFAGRTATRASSRRRRGRPGSSRRSSGHALTRVAHTDRSSGARDIEDVGYAIQRANPGAPGAAPARAAARCSAARQRGLTRGRAGEPNA
jgi:hypothetical protein